MKRKSVIHETTENISLQKIIILSCLHIFVSLVLHPTAFELTKPLILLIKLQQASNRQNPHDFPSISEVGHLLKFWLADTASRNTTAVPLRCTEYVLVEY